MNKKVKCFCGKMVEKGDIMHRGCRLKHAFPDAYTKEGNLLIFDVKKIKKTLKKRNVKRVIKNEINS